MEVLNRNILLEVKRFKGVFCSQCLSDLQLDFKETDLWLAAFQVNPGRLEETWQFGLPGQSSDYRCSIYQSTAVCL